MFSLNFCHKYRQDPTPPPTPLLSSSQWDIFTGGGHLPGFPPWLFQQRGPLCAPDIFWGNVSLHYGHRIASLLGHCTANLKTPHGFVSSDGKGGGCGRRGDSGEFRWHSYQMAFLILFFSYCEPNECQGHARALAPTFYINNNSIQFKHETAKNWINLSMSIISLPGHFTLTSNGIGLL